MSAARATSASTSSRGSAKRDQHPVGAVAAELRRRPADAHAQPGEVPGAEPARRPSGARCGRRARRRPCRGRCRTAGRSRRAPRAPAPGTACSAAGGRARRRRPSRSCRSAGSAARGVRPVRASRRAVRRTATRSGRRRGAPRAVRPPSARRCDGCPRSGGPGLPRPATRRIGSSGGTPRASLLVGGVAAPGVRSASTASPSSAGSSSSTSTLGATTEATTVSGSVTMVDALGRRDVGRPSIESPIGSSETSTSMWSGRLSGRALTTTSRSGWSSTPPSRTPTELPTSVIGIGASTSWVRSTCWKSTCITSPRTGWSCQSFTSTGRARLVADDEVDDRRCAPRRGALAEVVPRQRQGQRRAAASGRRCPGTRPCWRRRRVGPLPNSVRVWAVKGDVCHAWIRSWSGPTRECTEIGARARRPSAPAGARGPRRLRPRRGRGRRP